MQFIANGPDVPEALLQAQEEGRVVIFCGAGISYSADLPDFQGLVDRIYSRAGTKPNAIEQEAYNRKQFDATLDLLERRLPGQRFAVRKALAEVLKPKLRRKGATETHAALLQLARNQGGALRLVTTNFDRIFEVIAKRTKQLIQSYAAPMLPIPKNSRWDGLVYLHGLLPKLPDDGALNRLVVTSGDFGLAYLTERWAARFVSELFRNYVVCFVGYSIDDPVLRYMMDALAADRRQGEITPQAYAFGDVLQELTRSVTWWLEVVSKSFSGHEIIFMDLCRRILDLPIEPSTGILQNGKPLDEPVEEAINHSVGQIAQALLNFWFKGEPNDNDRLPAHIEPLFTQLCDKTVERFRHGRVLLASNLIALFRVDRPWAEANLLPLLDWASDPVEARAAWEGFLWSPRLYPPLLIAFKSQFLETARHYEELGEHHRQFAAFLVYAALELVDNYSPQDFQTAIGAFPQEGLEEAARALSQALEGAGEKREDYWKNRVQPFWHHVWPKSRDLASKEISESLVRLCLAAGSAFPSALLNVQDWLQPIEHLHYVVGRLDESGLCGQFPAEALQLLNAIIDDQPWAPDELGKCMGAISQANPTLFRDARYRRLEEFFRQRKM